MNSVHAVRVELSMRGTELAASPPRVHSGQCQSLSGTRVNGGLRQHRCHPLRHVSHSSMGLSASGASPHTMHGTSSSSSKSTVFSLTTYALSPTRKISPSRLIIFQYFRFGGRSCAAADFFFPLLAFDVVVLSLAFSLAFSSTAALALGAVGGARLFFFFSFFSFSFSFSFAASAALAPMFRRFITSANARLYIRFFFFFFFPSPPSPPSPRVVASSPPLSRFFPTGLDPSSAA